MKAMTQFLGFLHIDEFRKIMYIVLFDDTFDFNHKALDLFFTTGRRKHLGVY